MNPSARIPFYEKTAFVLISILSFIFIIYIGQNIIIPFVYAVIIAILLNPLVNFLIRKGVYKIVAITIALGLVIILCLLVFYIISTQISIFSKTYPLLKEKLNTMVIKFLRWFSEKFNIHQSKINTWIGDTEKILQIILNSNKKLPLLDS